MDQTSKERLETRDLIEAVKPASIIPDGPGRPEEPSLVDRLLTHTSHHVYITDRVAPWWNRKRDKWLWECLIRSDMLSSAIYVTSARLFSVPFNVVPLDPQNRRNREIAYWSDILLKESWSTEAFRFIVDWQTQDNGAFFEILGGGDPSGPIEPTLVPGTATYLYALGLRHLDSQRAIRTGDKEYPVKYEAKDSRGRWRQFKLHRSRVLFTAQMESPREDMLRVGFCGTSRTISHVLHMNDIDILKEEWLGSRPVSEIVFGKGMNATSIKNAFVEADERAQQDGQQRYAKTVFFGIDGSPELIKAASLERIQLKRLPEGYDEEKSITVAINVLAMGLGFDARTLWPATVRGATRADAEVQHLKTMKMTPGIFVETLTRNLQRTFSPVSCLIKADQQDDEQDAIDAQNRQSRANIRETMLASGQIDQRVNYEMMLNDGDLTESQYKYLISRLDTEGESVTTFGQPEEEEESGNSTEKEALAILEEMERKGDLARAIPEPVISRNGRTH